MSNRNSPIEEHKPQSSPTTTTTTATSSSSSASTFSTENIRDHYVTQYCCDREVQRIVSVQLMCGNDTSGSGSRCAKWTFWAQYFGFWSHLGSGPFYILLLCLFAWSGHPLFAAYLCISLSVTLYATDVIKDSLALPRPPSPPVLRGGQVTHALEYGFPSTHTACAAVLAHLMARYFLEHIGDPLGELFLTRNHQLQQALHGQQPHFGSSLVSASIAANFGETCVILLCAVFFVAHVSVSRMYLGLHWLGDILGGLAVYFVWAVGDWLFLRSCVTYLLGHVPWLAEQLQSTEPDHELFGGSAVFMLVPLLQICCWIFVPLLSGVWLIELHATPRDACPCFEDSVRFVGADCGLWLGCWTTILYYYFHNYYEASSSSSTTTTTATNQNLANNDRNHHHHFVNHITIAPQQQKYFVHGDFGGVPTFTLAGLSHPVWSALLFVVGIVLLILIQEVSAKYLIPPVLKPLMQFLSGNNNNASNSKLYKTFVWLVGAVVFLRISFLNKFLVSSYSLKNYKSLYNSVVEGNKGGEETGDNLFFKNHNNTNDNQGALSEENSNVTSNIQHKRSFSAANNKLTEEDVAFVRKEAEGGADVVRVNSETTVVTVVNNEQNNNNSDDENNGGGEHDHDHHGNNGNTEGGNSNAVSSSSSSSSTSWTLRCHTHWDEINIQSKYLSYVVLGFCAAFVWPQFLFPGMVQLFSSEGSE